MGGRLRGSYHSQHPPFIPEGIPPTPYTARRQLFSEAILRNLFHHFNYDFGLPPHHHELRKEWSRAYHALIDFEYLTENGRFITEKGYNYIKDHSKEFTPHA